MSRGQHSRRRIAMWSACGAVLVAIATLLILTVVGKRVVEPFANINSITVSGAVVGVIQTGDQPPAQCHTGWFGSGDLGVSWRADSLLPLDSGATSSDPGRVVTAPTPRAGQFQLTISGDQVELRDMSSGRRWVGHNVAKLQHTSKFDGTDNGDTTGTVDGQLSSDDGTSAVQVSGSWSCAPS